MRKGKAIALVVFAMGLLFLVAELLWSKYALTVSEYTLSVDTLTDSLRIVQLTDLHNSSFGQDNRRLVERVAEQQPDLIFITGDLLNSSTDDTTVATNLIACLSAICPVYLSLGNHELELEETSGVDIVALYEQAGAVVLEYDYLDLTVNGQALRIGGLYGYCLPEKYLSTGEAKAAECAFLTEFQDSDAYTILLTHMPVCWLINGGLEEWQVDCVFSGHVHGGEIVFPLIGGLWAPDFGWFPGKLQGLYTSSLGDSVLVLSTGLGTTELVPRFHNPPEIVALTLVPA